MVFDSIPKTILQKLEQYILNMIRYICKRGPDLTVHDDLRRLNTDGRVDGVEPFGGEMSALLDHVFGYYSRVYDAELLL
jgi:hypothetical protein